MDTRSRRLPDPESAPFGTFAPNRAARLILGDIDFDRPHRRWPLRRKIGKMWLRKSAHIFDIRFQGLKLRLQPASNVGDEGIVLNGIHGEEDEFAVVHERVVDFENFIDIGANIGLYSLIAARRLSMERPIVAFEPDADTAWRLRNHLQFNDLAHRVQVVEAAVGEQDGVLTLFRPPFNVGGTSAHRRFPHWVKAHCAVVRLDGAISTLQIERIGMLKIDIEGYEDQALLPYLESTPPAAWPRYVLIEVCHRRFWQRDVVTALRERGYREVFRNTRNLHFAL